MAFDTLAYAKHLEQAGVDRKQAEAHAEAMNQYLRPDLATKADLTEAERTLRGEIAALANRMDSRFSEMEKLIYQTQLRSLAIIAGMLGALFALLRFFPPTH